jgi:IclR family transcriptional regulator, mhp operon transcriptional activator
MQKTIRSLTRGIEVLQAFQKSPICALHDLHMHTGIPKPTLLRILHTLEQAGVVSRRLADGRYRISINLTHLGPRQSRHERVAEAAAPVLDRLCKKVRWPSDLLVPANDHMVIAETSQTHSPFPINISRIGQRINWLLSAVGRAYLASCPQQERERLVRRLSNSDKLVDQLARDPKRLNKILAETRERGYAIRDPLHGTRAIGSPPGDEIVAAIAVPLLGRARVYGSINILWIKSAFTIEEFSNRYLDDLREAAAEIAETLESTVAAQRRKSEAARRAIR